MDRLNTLISRRGLLNSSGTALAALAAAAVSRPPARAAAQSAPSPSPAAAPVPLNVQVSTDGPAAHIEPAIAADPRDPGTLLATCRVMVDGAIGVAGYWSADGGAHWNPGGLLPGPTPDFDGNPSVVFDRAGTGYIAASAATTTLPRRGDALLWRTRDGGRTLLPPVTVISGDGGLVDHCALATDPQSHGPVSAVYATAVLAGSARNGLVFTRSTDAGRSFTPPVFPAPLTGAQAPVLAAAPGGTVCVVYLAPTEQASVLSAVTSTDHGRSFPAPVPLATLASLAPGFGDILSAKSGPTLAADPATGRLYTAVTSYDDTDGTSRILLWTCTDRGHTWNGPTEIATSTSEIYLQPQLATHPAGAAISCYVADPATRRIDVRLYLSHTNDPANPVVRRVTSQPFDPTLAPGTPPWLGNYQGLTATRTALHPIWTDTRTGTAQIFTSAIRL